MNKDFSGHYGRDDRKPASSERRDGENGSERPARPSRDSQFGNRDNAGRPDRPNNSSGSSFGDRRRETSDRPERGGDRPDRGGFGDRPARPAYGDRGDRPDRGGSGDRPARPAYGDRGDRPDRGGFGDRPARPAFGDRGDRGDRPDRGGFGDRTARPAYGDRGDRPDRGGFGDRPARPSFNDRPDRPKFENRGDRPDRPKFDEARPDQGGFGDRGDRPARPAYGDRPDRGGFGDRPARNARPDGGYGQAPQRRFEAERRPNDPDYLVRGEARKSYGKSSDELERQPSHRSFDAWKEQSERGPSRGGDFRSNGGDRGPRNFDRNTSDRAPRRDFEDRAPRRDFDDRAPRRDFEDRAPRRDSDDRPARTESFVPKPATEERAGEVKFDIDPLSFLGQSDFEDGDDGDSRDNSSPASSEAASSAPPKDPNAPRDWRDYSSERRPDTRDTRSDYRDSRDSRPSRDDSRSDRPRFDDFQSRDRGSYGDRPDRPERSERGGYGDRPDRSDRSDRGDRPAFSRTREKFPDRNPHNPLTSSAAAPNRLAQADIRELPEEIRLNRFLSLAGVASRRKADELIEAGEIKVNGEIVSELGRRVHAKNDVVEYNNYRLFPEPPVYILLNKPKDYITTTDDPEERKTVMSLLDEATRERIYPVGRLDRNTTGLLLLTNDGELAMKLTHPSHEIAKLYEVHLDKPLRQADLDNLAEGVMLEDGHAQVDEIAYADPIDKRIIGVSLHIGRNRIVRRLFEHFGYTVEKLDRTIYAGLTKKDLSRGHWRYLNDSEVRGLKRL